MSNREIASALFITEGTVKIHVHHIHESVRFDRTVPRYHHENAYLLPKGNPSQPTQRIPDVLEWKYSAGKTVMNQALTLTNQGWQAKGLDSPL